MLQVELETTQTRNDSKGINKQSITLDSFSKAIFNILDYEELYFNCLVFYAKEVLVEERSLIYETGVGSTPTFDTSCLRLPAGELNEQEVMSPTRGS